MIHLMRRGHWYKRRYYAVHGQMWGPHYECSRCYPLTPGDTNAGDTK